MGIVADKLRNGVTSVEQMNSGIAEREAQEAQDSAASQDSSSSMWEDVKGFFGGIGSAIANHYNVTAYNDIKNSISDEDGNITPESIEQHENPVGSTYSGAFGQQSYEDHYNDPSYNMNNYPESFQSHVRDSLNSWGNTVSDDIAAVYNSGGADGKWKLYEDAVAKPAMMAAATPFVPAPARIAAGILGAPDMISSAINAGSDGYNDKDADGTGGVLGAIGGVGNALIAQPLQQLGQAAMHPIDTAEDIYQHPENLWHKVLEPGMIAEMGVRGGKKIYDNREAIADAAGNAKEFVRDSRDQGVSGAMFDRAVRSTDEAIERRYQAPERNDSTDMSDYYPSEEPTQSSFRTGVDDTVDSYVVAASAKYGVDPSLMAKVIEQESTYGRNPDAGGNLAQISDDLAREYGLDKTDPAQSIEGGARYLKSLIDDNGGDVREALAAYNGGPGNKQYGYADQVLGREIGGEMGTSRASVSGESAGSGMDTGEQAWLGQTMPHGSEGCVEAVVRVGSYHNKWLADEARKGETYVPNLVRDAGDRVIDFDPARLEKGDVIVYGDNDHVVLYDGNGGYVGNSSSQMRVVHGGDYREMGGLQPTKIIKTADRNGNTGNGFMPDDMRSARDAAEAESEARTTYENNHAFDEINKEIDKENEWAPLKEEDAPDSEVFTDTDKSTPIFGDATPKKVRPSTGVTEKVMQDEVNEILSDEIPTPKKARPSTGITEKDMEGDISNMFDETPVVSPIKKVRPSTGITEADGSTGIVLDEAVPSIKKRPSTGITEKTNESSTEYLEAPRPLEKMSDASVRAMAFVKGNEPVLANAFPKSERKLLKENGLTHVDEASGFEVADVQAIREEAQARGMMPGKKVPDTEFSVNNGPAPKKSTIELFDTADLPEYKNGRKIKDTVSKQDILQRAEELFAPVYDGFTGRTIDGFTRTKTGELRTGKWGDIDTMAHELGHIVDNHLDTGNKRMFLDEFRENVERNHGADAYEASHIEREGVADFLKDYLADESLAKSNFPQYYRRFKEQLAKNPDMQRRVGDLQDLYGRYNGQSGQARWGSSITYGKQPQNKTFGEKVSDAVNTVDKKVYDDLTELKGLDKVRAKLKGVKELATESSIYKMARLSRGQASAYTEMLIKGTDPVGTIKALNTAFGDKGIFQHNVTLKSAMDIVKKATKTREGREFLEKGNYKDAMQAMDAVLSARRFSELQKLDLDKLRGLRQRLGETIQQMSEDTKNGKKHVLEAAETQKIYDDLEAGYGRDFADSFMDTLKRKVEGEHAVDDHNFIQHEDTPGHVLIGARMILNDYIENLSELQKRYVDEYPAPGKITDAQSVIDAAPKEFHAAAEEIYKLQDNVMRAYKDAGLISEAQYTAMQKYKNYVPLATDFGVSRGMSKMFGNDSMFVNIGDEIKSQVAKDSREKVLPIKSPLATIVGNTHDMLGKAVRNKIGQLLVEDIDKKNGARLATEVKGAADPNKKTFNVWIDGEKHTYQTTPEIYKVLESCGDVKTATFAVKVLRAGATLTRTMNVLGPAFQAANFIRDTFFASFRTTNGWLDLMNPAKPGYGRAAYHLIHDAIGKDSVMEEYRATGAKMSTLAAYGHEPIQMEIMKLAGEQGKKRKVWDTFNDRVLRFGESVEAMPRLREYMRVREKGGSFEDAAYAARNITIDFSRAGEWGRDWNQIDAFCNASLQGTKVLYETAKENPKRFMKDLTVGCVIPTIAYWSYTRSQDWYADRPDWEKNSYWLFKNDTLAHALGFKDGIVKLPKSQEVGILFGSGMEAMLDATIGGKKAKDIFPGWAKAEADTILPNLFSNAATTPFELMANYSIFTGHEIVPDKLKKLPADKQVTDKTSWVAKTMADDINKIFGSKVSPMQVDFAGKGVLGNLYKIPSTGSLGFDRFEGKGTSSKALSKYYEVKEDLTAKYNGINDDSYDTGRVKNAKDQKSRNVNKMNETDAYNYRRMQEADKAMRKIGDAVKKNKMSEEDGQKAKINIARAIKWR